MQDHIKKLNEIVDALGGSAKVAKALGVKRVTVSRWRTRGVSIYQLSALINMATEAGLEVTFSCLKPDLF